jgi:hypothetical protein
LGQEAEVMAEGLKEYFASILSGSQQADQNTQNLINSLITVGEAGGGAAGGFFGPVGAAVGAFGSAIVGEGLRLFVGGGTNPNQAQINAAIAKLKADGINVSAANNGGLENLQTQFFNADYSKAFSQGLTAAYEYYNS